MLFYRFLNIFCFYLFLLTSIQDEPVEGFRVNLVNEDNMFEWEVAIFGPPETLYQGGYFKVSGRVVYFSLVLTAFDLFFSGASNLPF